MAFRLGSRDPPHGDQGLPCGWGSVVTRGVIRATTAHAAAIVSRLVVGAAALADIGGTVGVICATALANVGGAIGIVATTALADVTDRIVGAATRKRRAGSDDGRSGKTEHHGDAKFPGRHFYTPSWVYVPLAWTITQRSLGAIIPPKDKKAGTDRNPPRPGPVMPEINRKRRLRRDRARARGPGLDHGQSHCRQTTRYRRPCHARGLRRGPGHCRNHR